MGVEELTFGGEDSTGGGFFQVQGGGDLQIFDWRGGTPPIPSSRGNPDIYICKYNLQ